MRSLLGITPPTRRGGMKKNQRIWQTRTHALAYLVGKYGAPDEDTEPNSHGMSVDTDTYNENTELASHGISEDFLLHLMPSRSIRRQSRGLAAPSPVTRACGAVASHADLRRRRQSRGLLPADLN